MEESRQSRGLGSFFFAAIPWVLGMAALTWLGFYTGIITFHQAQLAIQKSEAVQGRMDGRVGVDGDVRDPVSLTFHGRGCIKVERAYLDLGTMTAYLHNTCNREIRDIRYSWREVSPDGTTVKSGWDYLSGSDDMAGDEKREQQVQIDIDDGRVKGVVFSIEAFNDFQL